MPSSISSSDPAGTAPRPRWRWAVAWTLALITATLIVGGTEYLWRTRGYRPGIRDSAELWSIQRDRVYASRKTPLVLLGASRIEFGVDMKQLAALLPQYQPVMLAQNGHVPLAALQDLAEDAGFHGTVICDIDARGLSQYYRDAQQTYVDYYHRQWSPSWHLHRLLLTLWQRQAVTASPDFGVAAQLGRWIGSPAWPWRSYVRLHADRSGDIDFNQTDRAALTQNFVAGLQEDLRAHPPESVDVWLEGLAPIAQWTAAIRKRGGSVIFVQTPTTGALRHAEDAAYQRSAFWDRLAAAVDAPTIHHEDVPAFAGISLPDGSHVYFRDKPAYTRALVDALVARGLLR